MAIELMAVCDSCHKAVPAVGEGQAPEGWFALGKFTDSAQMEEWYFCSLFCVASGVQELAKEKSA